MAFLASHDYESAVREAVSLGGDADTMACIAGGIAEAYYGEIPENIRRFCTPRIDLPLRKIVERFEEKYGV
jgi:ADP-ribosylglycohydrolase